MTRTYEWRSATPGGRRWEARGLGGRRFECVKQNVAAGGPRWKAYVTTGTGTRYVAGGAHLLAEAKKLCENWVNPDHPSNRP